MQELQSLKRRARATEEKNNAWAPEIVAIRSDNDYCSKELEQGRSEQETVIEQLSSAMKTNEELQRTLNILSPFTEDIYTLHLPIYLGQSPRSTDPGKKSPMGRACPG